MNAPRCEEVQRGVMEQSCNFDGIVARKIRDGYVLDDPEGGTWVPRTACHTEETIRALYADVAAVGLRLWGGGGMGTSRVPGLCPDQYPPVCQRVGA